MRAAQRNLASNRWTLRSSKDASGVVSRATSAPSGTTATSDPSDVYGVPTVLDDTLAIVGLGYLPNALDILRDEDGAPRWDVVVSCLSPYDRVTPRTLRTLDQWSAAGHAIGFPIFDRSLPSQLTATILLARALNDRRSRGARVLVGCGAGCGRSGMIAATLLVASDTKVLDALTRVEQRRGTTLRSRLRVTEPIIEEPSQRAFVDLFARAWPIATAAPDVTPLFAGVPLGVDPVSPAELQEVRSDLEAHADYEAAIVALATLGAANVSPRHDYALQEVAALLQLPGSPAHGTTVDFSVGQQPATPEARTKLLAILDEAWAEATGIIDRSGHTVLMSIGHAASESAPARADIEPQATSEAQDSGPERATASSDTARQPAPSSPAGAPVRVDIDIDEKFESFLLARTSSRTAMRLARSSYYGGAVFDRLYPADSASPPDLPGARTAAEGMHSARPKFAVADVQESERIVRDFVRDEWDRYVQYQRLSDRLSGSPTG